MLTFFKLAPHISIENIKLFIYIYEIVKFKWFSLERGNRWKKKLFYIYFYLKNCSTVIISDLD